MSNTPLWLFGQIKAGGGWGKAIIPCVPLYKIYVHVLVQWVGIPGKQTSCQEKFEPRDQLLASMNSTSVNIVGEYVQLYNTARGPDH